MKNLAHVLLVSLLALPAYGEETSSVSSEVRDFLADKKQDFNGVVLLAAKGRVICHEAFGFASAAQTTRLRKDSVFRLASVAKAFTGMAILLLEIDGKVSLDADVRRYLPELPYEGVTVRHLVHHTSGLPDYVSLLEENWDVENRGKPDRKIATSPDALARLVKHQPKVRFAPGERWEYSNTGYVLLGLIVEKASGQAFGEFLKKRIFDPLDMKNTVLFTPKNPPTIEHRAFGFRRNRLGAAVPNDHNYLNGMYGDGEVYSTVTDLLKWDRALSSEKLARKDQLSKLFRSGHVNDGRATNYGFGWQTNFKNGKHFISHSGSWVGFRSRIERNVTDDTTLIILTNSSQARFRDQAKRIHALLAKHTASSAADRLSSLRDALSFHASFDKGADADYALGDPRMHTSLTGKPEDGRAGETREDVTLVDGGKFGKALRFADNSKAIVYFRGKHNVAYEKDKFDGSYSFWLSLDPAVDLKPGFSDPLQTTDKKWNDSSFFVDFSKANPRDFRLGVFSDFKVWNPKNENFEKLADSKKPMVFVKKPPFASGRWTHVVFTYEGFNRGDDQGSMRLFLDGTLQGERRGRYHFTWDLDQVRLMLGLSYIGLFDDLSVFDRALSAKEVADLYKLDGGVRTLGKWN